MSRDDIRSADVFVGWTSKDKTIKDQICNYLRKKNLEVLDSDKGRCAGNFEEWSKEAVPRAHVYLIISSRNIEELSYAITELKVALFMPDAANRILPIVEGLNSELYNRSFTSIDEKRSFSLREADESKSQSLKDKKVSAVICENMVFDENKLIEIYEKVERLLVNQLVPIYKEELNKKTYMAISPLLIEAQKEDFEHKDIYVQRTLIRADENKNSFEEISSNEEILKENAVTYIYGEGGCGKTEFLKYLIKSIDDNRVAIKLKCSEVATALLECNTKKKSRVVFEQIYETFKSICGEPIYCSEEDFKTILVNHQFILVFDGIDEIITEKATNVFVAGIKEYFEHSYSRGEKTPKLIFTGRQKAEANKLDFFLNGEQLKIDYLELQKLTEEKIKQLIDNIFLKLSDSDKGEQFYLAISEIDKELKSNPFLLTQLALVYSEDNIIPQNELDLFDKVMELLLKNDDVNEDKRLYDDSRFSDMTAEPETIAIWLEKFAVQRYISLSEGKSLKEKDIFEIVLKKSKEFPESSLKARASYLVDYLEKRSILIENNFYHGLLLQYFTAVGYYNMIYNDEFIEKEKLEELFKHYNDSSWKEVLEMFFIKVDSILDEHTLIDLMNIILEDKTIIDYTLLFDSCQKLKKQRKSIELILTKDILIKSTTGVFPPYGPLFYYVPQYELYESCIYALNEKELKGNAKALALVRDACFIYGLYNNINEITNEIDGQELFNAVEKDLKGVRKALCEIFYLGDTDYTGGDNIYPRCFNVLETKLLRDRGYGIEGIMSSPFEDELLLFEHEQYNEMNGEIIGFISCPNDKESVEPKLQKFNCKKMTCMSLSPTNHNNNYDIYNFYRRSIKQIYVSENCFSQNYINILFSLTRGIRVRNTLGINYINNDIKIASTVEKIEFSAFQNCKNLRKVDFSKATNLRIIGSDSFAGCENLTEIQIPSKAEEIGYSAFKNCKNLRKVDFSKATSLRIIGFNSFAGCENLTEIQIPSKAEEIRGSTFQDCKNLRKADFSKATNLRIIGFNSFADCENLTEIQIPSKAEEMYSAFKNCKNLRKADFSKATNLRIIGSDSFADCENLTEIQIPSKVEEIRGSTFQDCKNLRKADFSKATSLRIIGSGSFKGCENLTEIQIPSKVEEIGYYAFQNCENLRKVDFSKATSLRIIGFNSFAGCENLTEIQIPSKAEEIRGSTFQDCKNLRKADFSKATSLRIIGPGSFAGCENLLEIQIPSKVEEIWYSAFQNCKNLRKVDFSKATNLRIIGSDSFAGCENLLEIQIPSKVVEIESSVFQNCRNSREVNLLSLARFKKIGHNSFEGCENLTEIQIPSEVGEIRWSAFQNCENLRKVDFSKATSLRIIGPSSFEGCENLLEIQMPSGIVEIEFSAFQNCKNLRKVDFSKATSLEKIGHNSFEGCENLLEIQMPSKVVEIGFSAFRNCKNLRKVDFSDSTSLEAMGSGSFEGCEDLTEIQIPSKVKGIYSAFQNCKNLRKADFSKATSLRIIGSDSFAGCENLTEIQIPSGIVEIEFSAFQNCKNLRKVDFSDSTSLEKIGHNSFAGCESLTEIQIPSEVEEIGHHAFKDCKNLRKADFSKATSLEKIGHNSFAGCENLEEVEIPTNVLFIEDNTFYLCTNLKKIKISRNFENDIERIFGNIDKSIIEWID